MTKRKHFRVAVIGGDGIGPEVVDAAIPSIERAAAIAGGTIAWERLPYGADHFLRTGETLPDHAFEHLKHDVDAILVGALGDPRVPDQAHARDILLGLRFRLDLYINFRPCTLLHPDLCPLKGEFGAVAADGGAGGWADGEVPKAANRPTAQPPNRRVIDFVIFRENTEGLYLARGSSRNVGTKDEEQIAEEVHTAPKVNRIIRAAFEWARAHGRRRVTMADKSNAVPAHHLWQRVFAEVATEFPGIEHEHYYVDALCMQLVKRPDRFDVIVTNNMFGDILSDLGSQLVGGLGIAPSANLHPGQAGLFEPVHGSAPKYAGQGTANPLATILTGALMLEQLGLGEGAARLTAAVRASLEGGVRTRDLGGTATTRDVATAVAGAV
ncbi:MAG: isocitrate/isopropylmalate dehydrogenase family protein [Gemmatimonadetes bacterium]|nr:isocitrate/isopropylmalate dehydrogenase family protein [Gemmatimonadota bacterium]